MNARYDERGGVPSGPGFRISRCPRPATKILLIDESPDSVNDGYYLPGGHESHAGAMYSSHNGRMNFTFLDGHVEALDHDTCMAIQFGALQQRYYDPTDDREY